MKNLIKIFLVIVLTVSAHAIPYQYLVYQKKSKVDTIKFENIDQLSFKSDSILVINFKKEPFKYINFSSIDSIIVEPIGGPPLQILAPRENAIFTSGDTLTFQWRVNPLALQASVYFRISLDNGNNWHQVFNEKPEYLIYPSKYYSNTTGTWKWKIPKTIDIEEASRPLQCNQCIVQILQYGLESDEFGSALMTGSFKIVSDQAK